MATVEFAVTVFILLLVGAGVAEFGRAFFYYDAVAKGTRDAARHLSTVPVASWAGATSSAQGIVTAAATAGGVPSFGTGNVSVSCAPTACGSSGVNSVTVSAQYALTLGALFPFIASANAGSNSFAVTLAPHTTMPYMW